jgi:hypothetical protein
MLNISTFSHQLIVLRKHKEISFWGPSRIGATPTTPLARPTSVRKDVGIKVRSDIRY